MRDRLSNHELRKTLDSGQSSLSWTAPAPSGFLAGIDLDAVMERPEAKSIIQAMPPQPLYYSIKHRGLAECTDVLPLLTGDQFTRMLDYDIWHQDALSLSRFVNWIEAYAQVSPKELCTRFVDLDEEYQLSLLQGKFAVFTEEDLSQMPEEQKDDLFPMPCKTIFYRLFANDADESAALQVLMSAIIEENLSYAYALIRHCSYMPPNEAEGLNRQFRLARLEEDGFVSYQESLQLFSVAEVAPIISKWASFRAEHSVTDISFQPDNARSYMDRVLELAQSHGWTVDEQFTIHQGLLYVTNALTAASQVEAHDAHGLARVMELGRGMIGLGLEALSGGQELLALEILKQEAPQALFKVGNNLIGNLRQGFLSRCKRYDLPASHELDRAYKMNKFSTSLEFLDSKWRDFVGFETTEVLRGLFNRYPMTPSAVSRDNDVKRYQFKPIDSLGSYSELAARVSAILGMFDFLASAGVKFDGKSGSPLNVDQAFMTIAARRLVGEQALFLAFSRNEVKALVELKASELDGLVNAFLVEVKQFANSRYDEWSIFPGELQKESSINFLLHMMSDTLIGMVAAWHQGGTSLEELITLDKEETNGKFC